MVQDKGHLGAMIAINVFVEYKAPITRITYAGSSQTALTEKSGSQRYLPFGD